MYRRFEESPAFVLSSTSKMKTLYFYATLASYNPPDYTITLLKRPQFKISELHFLSLYYIQSDTRKRELWKTPTKIEEIQEKKIIDRN